MSVNVIRLLILLLLVLGMTAMAPASAAPSARTCKRERDLFVNACKALLFGNLPSSECCERMRVTHLGCVCPIITSKLAALIDFARAVRLVEGCGRRLPRPFKCGGITVP